MARRKSDAEVGTLGVWAYNTRDALDLSVEEAVAALPTTYHPATLRKVEGGSARPGTRMWRELGKFYADTARERGIDIEPQPKLRPEPLETTETAEPLIAALRDLAAEIRLSRAEEAVTRQEMMRAIAALAGGRALRGTPAAGEPGIPVGELR